MRSRALRTLVARVGLPAPSLTESISRVTQRPLRKRARRERLEGARTPQFTAVNAIWTTAELQSHDRPTVSRKLLAIRRLASARSLSTVGVVGAGNMGRGIAASLARSAGARVRHHGRPAGVVRGAARGDPAADSLAVLCRLADAGVVVSVGEAAERAVFLGPGGLCEVAPAGALLVDCGTVTVDFARELHGTCGARGLRFLDAPVSGGPEGAANGTLSIMAGGAAADFEAARPVLDGMGGYVVRMGDGGAGALTKLINQLLTASNSLAASEALALARRSGLDDPASLKALLALLEHRGATRRCCSAREASSPTPSPAVAAAVAAAAASSVTRCTAAAAGAAATASPSAAAAVAPRASPSAAPLLLPRPRLRPRRRRVGKLQLPTAVAARQAVRRAAAIGKDDADWAYVSELHDGKIEAAAAAADPRACARYPPTGVPPRQSQPADVFDAQRTRSSRTAAVARGERALLLRCGVLAARRGAPLAVIDDDPTGTQTVHSVPVLADWSVDALEAALREDVPCFYVLSNTRALPREEAVARAEEIGATLRAAAERIGLPPTAIGVVSRGDSTLRGHYPHETDALAAGLGTPDTATLLAPFFFEGGRLRRMISTMSPPPTARAA